MSRIGKKPIIIPKGVKIEQQGTSIKVTGSLGSLQMDCHRSISVKVDIAAGHVLVENKQPELRRARQLHGTMRALIANMVTGVSKGFEKGMEIYGTGYSIEQRGDKLILQVGFCHSIGVQIPKGVKVTIEAGATRGDEVPARFVVSGIDKALVGQFAADIRKIKPPEPYKGKGIRYVGEHVRRKVGKVFASGTA